VRVPLGNRTVIGCVADPDVPHLAPAELKDIVEVIDDGPFLPAAVVDLALFVGEYYAAGPGAALALAMPVAARSGAREAFRRVRVVELAAAGVTSVPEPRGKQQQALMALLRERGDAVGTKELAGAGFGAGTIAALVKAGHARTRDVVSPRDPFAVVAGQDRDRWTLRRDGAEPEFTPEQADAFRRLEEAAAARQFRTVLLHGVTGSGKTEIYLRLARRIIEDGRRVLMLVPEISLTPSAAGQLRARFGDRVAIQHSALSDGERHDQWQRIRQGEVDIVIGTRSAVFAPLENVGLVIVDEEHDTAYKQEEAPRYHGRDVAIVRARMEGALALLGSATPALETSANVDAGRYDRVRLTKRVLDRPLASVRVVSMREEYAAEGADLALSKPLLEAIAARLGRGEQALVLLNRRGYATVLFCRECGASMECPNCSVSLTYHRQSRRVRCHYCNYAAPVPRACGACAGQFLEQMGFGTERIEADLRQRFPGARIQRVDRDTVRRRGAIAGILAAVAAGEIDIVVGTQMIAKGHDFPAVTLVGVISADVGLGLADFRAAERTFQLLTQVVGRAGRGDTPGEAIVQTLYPGHYAVEAAAAQDYGTFYTREMEFRHAMRYPPTLAMINVIVKGKTAEAALADAHDLVVRTRHQHPHGVVIGPAPAALARLKNEYRAQFFLKGKHRTAMREALMRVLEARADLKRRVIVDVDPISVL
jgi:primosomal protein N' (replication factor Y)